MNDVDLYVTVLKGVFSKHTKPMTLYDPTVTELSSEVFSVSLCQQRISRQGTLYCFHLPKVSVWVRNFCHIHGILNNEIKEVF